MHVYQQKDQVVDVKPSRWIVGVFSFLQLTINIISIYINTSPFFLTHYPEIYAAASLLLLFSFFVIVPLIVMRIICHRKSRLEDRISISRKVILYVSIMIPFFFAFGLISIYSLLVAEIGSIFVQIIYFVTLIIGAITFLFFYPILKKLFPIFFEFLTSANFDQVKSRYDTGYGELFTRKSFRKHEDIAYFRKIKIATFVVFIAFLLCFIYAGLYFFLDI